MFRFFLDGSLGDFEWEAGMSRGQSTINGNQRVLNRSRFDLAIDAGINPATGEIDCKWNYDPDYTAGDFSQLEVAGWPGSIFGAKGDCAPLNPFGANMASPEAIDYLMAQYSEWKVELKKLNTTLALLLVQESLMSQVMVAMVLRAVNLIPMMFTWKHMFHLFLKIWTYLLFNT
jgi:hypothetical protein